MKKPVYTSKGGVTDWWDDSLKGIMKDILTVFHEKPSQVTGSRGQEMSQVVQIIVRKG